MIFHYVYLSISTRLATECNQGKAKKKKKCWNVHKVTVKMYKVHCSSCVLIRCNSSTSTSHLFWLVLSLSKPAFAVISSRNSINTKTIQLTVSHEDTIKSPIRRASKFNSKRFCDYSVLLWRNSRWTHHFNVPSAEITLLPTKTNIFRSSLQFKIPAAKNIG